MAREKNRIAEARGKPQRAIKNAMAELEAKVLAFSNDLVAGGGNQAINGVPIVSFLSFFAAATTSGRLA